MTLKPRVTVLGLGKSGLESALFLNRRKFDVFVSESGRNEMAEKNAEILKGIGIAFELGRHTGRALDADWVLVSPGIPPHSDIYQKCRKARLPILSEIEVASLFCPTQKIIAVTGTSGKTTAVTLIERILRKASIPVLSCGNIGRPWIGELDKLTPDHFVVLEVSSFQLEHCYGFRPSYAVWTNISPNHEDWHGDMAHYVEAKFRLFQSQGTDDTAVLRMQDYERYIKPRTLKARIIFYDENPAADLNQSLLYTMGKLLGVSSAQVSEVLHEFRGLEHRLEKVAELRGVSFINDSKCTTTASLAWALSKFEDKSVILIAGGRAKSKDFAEVKDLLKRKAKLILLIGESSGILSKAWSGAAQLIDAVNLKRAFDFANDHAKSGDVVLFSPACASFDQFRDYIHRGNEFKSYVNERLRIGVKAPLHRL